MTSKVRRLLVPAATTLVMLGVLVGLGTWQVQRLAWKRGLLAQIAEAETRPAIPLPAYPPPFAKVSVTGTLRTDLAALYGAEVRDERNGPVFGGQLIEPLERPGQPPLLVVRGWVRTQSANAGPPPQPPAAGQVAIEGYVRAPDHAGGFAAKDDVSKRVFYTLDPAAIGAALGLPLVAPYTLVAMGPPATQPGQPNPVQHLPRPPNDHLSYAITWYGLAATLVVIFGLFARKVMQS
jgi:surfeit locus 1 family protein